MKKIFLTQFKEMCEERNIKKLVFASLNQNEGVFSDTVDFDIHLSLVFVGTNPNLIHMRVCGSQDNNMITLGSIKYVMVEDTCIIGIPFHIICEDDNGNTIQYTLLGCV